MTAGELMPVHYAANGSHDSRGHRMHSSDNFDGWYPLRVRHGENQVFNGWWQHTRDVIRTVVALPAAGAAHSSRENSLHYLKGRSSYLFFDSCRAYSANR